MKIFFYAFANTSYIFNKTIKLANERKMNITWGMIYPRAVYKDMVLDCIDKENTLYLYENFEDKYNQTSIDEIQFNDNDWVDNIYTILETSKFGYKKEKSNKQLKVIYILYQIYKKFLIETKPDYVVFPSIETVNGTLLVNICKELNIEVMESVHTRSMNKSYFAQDYRESKPVYYGNYTSDNLLESEGFLNKKNNKSLIRNQIVSTLGTQNISIKPYAPLIIRTLLSFKNYFLYEKKGIFDTSFYLRLRTNFERYFDKWRHLFFKYYQIKYFDIKSEKDDVPKKFILFLLQFTPESSINTFEQYFIEQEKAIDLIRLNMPNNYYLLLKEHPQMRGLRASSWYKRMNMKAGVKLVSHHLSTNDFVDKSKLVATITGSVAIECYVSDKPIIMFGRNFFSHIVDNFDSFKNLKKELKLLIDKEKFDSNKIKIEKIAKIYNISYDFYIEEVFVFERIMSDNNIKNFLEAIISHTERVKNFKEV